MSAFPESLNTYIRVLLPSLSMGMVEAVSFLKSQDSWIGPFDGQYFFEA